MKINKEELYKLYMKKVKDICEECSWIAHFGPEEIVTIIAGLLEENPALIKTSDDKTKN